jgi:hypothetical protein
MTQGVRRLLSGTLVWGPPKTHLEHLASASANSLRQVGDYR